MNLQVFVPLGLALLKAYEHYDPAQPQETIEQTWQQVLGSDAVNDSVVEFVNAAVRREVGREGTLDLLGTPITFDLEQVHTAFWADRSTSPRSSPNCAK